MTGKVVLIHRYFMPDTPPYAHILERIASRLAADGHDVTVLTCQPSYRPTRSPRAPAHETRNGYRVVRWSVIPDRRSTMLRALNLVVFCFRLLASRRQFAGSDVVMAATTPPVLLAAVASFVARRHGARFVYHKQDIYPEVLPPSRQHSLLGRALRRLDVATERRSAAVVVLSDDMAATVADRHATEPPIVVLNNFDPWPVREDGGERPHGERLTVVFAGNMGRFQGLDVAIELVRRLDAAPIDFHFFGDGARSAEIERLAEEVANVCVHGYRPPSEVADFVRSRADLGLVSLEAGVIGAAYPSKTMTYLRHGCPLLVIVEDSELSMMVKTEGIGVVGSHQDVLGLTERLKKCAATPHEVRSMRDDVRRTYEERFSADVQLARWSDLYRELVAR